MRNDERLLKLATYLEALPKRTTQFNMGWYRHDKSKGLIGPTNLPIECGSSACALGHAPQCGPGFEVLEEDKDWLAYAERVFGMEPDWAYLWCFSGCWAGVDNTARGAAARIRWLVEHGRPPATAFMQMNGETELCYTV